ncbi:MAG: family 10 glycosylhydrolase [Verrucomicrobiales bacterium]
MRLPLVFGLLLFLAPSFAPAQTIRIADFHVDEARVEPGETFTVAAMTDGGGNHSLRHEHSGDGDPLPGWLPHNSDFAFLPSDDFDGPGPYKNPEMYHKDNGEHDLDRREGVFRLAVETTGWPEGTYRFQLMATNRPELGTYVGDSKAFTVLVGTHADANGIGKRVEIEINGRRCAEGDPPWPILPGQPNRLTVSAGESGDLSLKVAVLRTQPDGRRVRLSATLTEQSLRTTFDLGLFAVPAEFDFEAGVLSRRGCLLRLEIGEASPAPGGKPLETLDFHQTIDPDSQRDALELGALDSVPHLGWRIGGSRPMDPPVLLRLDEGVLDDPDDVVVHYQLRTAERRLDPEQSLSGIPAVLRVTPTDGNRPVHEEPVEVLPEPGKKRLHVADWNDGRYRIEIVPRVDGSEDRHGPAVVYRRKRSPPGSVPLSPLAPWAMERDDSRPEVVVEDFRKAVEEWSPGLPDDRTWAFHEAGPGQVFLVTPPGDPQGAPVVLSPGLDGAYAVFATTEKGNCYLRVGAAGIVRGILGEPCFVEAVDMTDGEVAIHPASVPGSGLRELRFVPVTRASADRVAAETREPPVPLRGVSDWCDYFAPPSSHHSAGGRVGEDQFDALLRGHAELGMGSIGWSIGRSWVEYDSKLSATTRFPCAPIPPQHLDAYAGREAMVNDYDPLAGVLRRRGDHGLEILPWLAMQRHYGETAYGGIFCSDWFRAHPEWRRWSKNASSSSGNAVSYYFPEVRKERVDILCEVAERGPDALVIGWCRQVPILLYHPEMVEEYRTATGVDPLKIDGGDEKEYGDWIRWRADFVTETLRELKSRLEPVREKTGRPIPVVVRIPSKGLFYNMAQGLDVETWCREGLIHQIQLDPLEDCGWRGEPHDVRPYLELGRRHDLSVFGGINGNTFWNYTAIMRRALGLLEAGVAGIELYESNNFASSSPERWIVPLLGHPERLRDFLENSSLDACYPVWSRSAASGYDNHSFSGNWSVYGTGGNAL